MLLAAGAVVLIGAAVVADGYYQAYRAYQDVADVFPQLQTARAALAGGRVPSNDSLAQASGEAAQAQARLDHARFTLSATAALPWLGRPVQAIRQGVAAAEDEAQAATTVRDMLVDLLGPEALSGRRGGPAPVFRNGTIDVNLVESLGPRLAILLQQLRAGDAAIRAIPSVPFFHRVDELKAQALNDSTQALRLAVRANAAVKVLPGFLGAHGDRTYFMALQNNDDQRGTGGAVLAYALVHIDHGKISLAGGGPVNGIDNTLRGIHVPMPPGIAWYVHAARVNPRINNGANYSPNFPDVAQTWAAMVRKSVDQPVDGVIAMDPQAIADALDGERPIRVRSFPGPISADNVVAVTENQQYLLPKSAQFVFPAQLVAAAFKVFTNPRDVTALVREFSTALAQKRVQLWSQNPQEQQLLAQLGWDGGLQHHPGDYLYLVQNKRVANKVDYFAQQSIHDTVDVLPSGGVRSTYQVTLTGDVPFGQGSSIVGPWSPYGLNLAMMSLYVPKRSTFVRVDPPGPFPHSIQPWSGVAHVQPAGFVQHVEGDFRVLTQTIAAWRDHPAHLTFTYTTPGVIQKTSQGHVYELTIQHQPMTNPADVTVTVHLPPGSNVQSVDPGWLVTGDTATFRATLTHDVVTRIVF
ncbi:MAG TPA: DUF4012 domain-containing protein [Actinomycetota bacterium]